MVDPLATCHPLGIIKDILTTSVDVCKTINRINYGGDRRSFKNVIYKSSIPNNEPSKIPNLFKEKVVNELLNWFSENNILEPKITDYIHGRINSGYQIKSIKYNKKQTKVTVKYFKDNETILDIYSI